MKKLTTLLMTLMLMSMVAWADETVTVSANSSDISDGLDLKVVAKLFAEAKNLEEFETMLNNPDSAFCNLDLNGDGQVDYLRVIETGEGSKRLIVLQAVLAKDIYQDVASIYVEKNEKDEVSVQIIGDEYVYGTNYIIEPVYVYRPLIYDWFWCDAWFAWHSPWYWGYYPGWWYVHRCWAYDAYWHHCYAFHHHHHCCSFRPGREVRHGYHEMHSGVARRDMAAAHPERSFSQRNNGMTNARARSSAPSSQRASSGNRAASSNVASRTYGSQNTAATRNAGVTASRSTQATTAPRSSLATTAAGRTPSTVSSSRNSNAVRVNSTPAASSTRSQVNTTSTRSTANYNTTRTTAPTSSRTSSSYSGSSSRSSSSYSGGGFSGGSRGGGGGFSGGGGASRGGGGGGSVRR